MQLHIRTKTVVAEVLQSDMRVESMGQKTSTLKIAIRLEPVHAD